MALAAKILKLYNKHGKNKKVLASIIQKECAPFIIGDRKKQGAERIIDGIINGRLVDNAQRIILYYLFKNNKSKLGELAEHAFKVLISTRLRYILYEPFIGPDLGRREMLKQCRIRCISLIKRNWDKIWELVGDNNEDKNGSFEENEFDDLKVETFNDKSYDIDVDLNNM